MWCYSCLFSNTLLSPLLLFPIRDVSLNTYRDYKMAAFDYQKATSTFLKVFDMWLRTPQELDQFTVRSEPSTGTWQFASIEDWYCLVFSECMCSECCLLERVPCMWDKEIKLLIACVKLLFCSSSYLRLHVCGLNKVRKTKFIFMFYFCLTVSRANAMARSSVHPSVLKPCFLRNHDEAN